MARRRDSSSSDSSEKEDGEFLQKESENTVRKSESNSSDSDRETRKRRSGGGRRRSPERRERVERRRSASDSGEEELERRRVERERDRRKTDAEDGRRRYNAGKETKERDSDRKNSDGEVDKGRRDDSGRREREESDKEDDGRDKDRSRKREEGRYGDRERDYERRRKSEREGNRRREDNDRGSRGRHRGSEGKEEDGDDKELEQRDGNVRRSEGKDKRYKERGKYSERERDDDEKDDRKDRRQRSSRHVENDDKGHRRQELEDRNVGREDDKGADHGKERRKEQDRERETKREDEGKDRRRRKEDAENMVENEGKLDERRGEGRVTDDVKVPKLENLGRSGGVYIPPFKLARMMKEVEDKSSLEYQRMTWVALRKSINGLVNKVNATNIKNIIPELFAENLIRGRGLFCRSCMKSQMASPAFTDVFAALVAVVNTKFPEVGELLLKRIILQLQRAYKRNDKPQLLAAVKFIAHLVNQQIVHELIALELLTILLENPTDDSVEVAVGFVTECGSILQDLCARGLHGIFERFRGILHEGEIDKRVQFLIEGLFALRKAKFSSYPAVRPELDLVEQEDQLTHEISLSDQIEPEIALDIFKQDPNFLENERKYEEVKKSILGEESEDEEAGSDEGDEESDEDEEESDEEDEEQMKIKDETETNLINLRRTIYLTIMSSVDFEEAGHKLMKIKLEPGQEMELCIMMLECCSQERTYLRYYGLLGQRFCMINKVYQENFDKCFVQQYSMIHRLETNKLRNVAKFFAHLLGTHALPWQVLAYIRLTEEDTTSSSRIFIKILFQELSEHLGIRLLNERLNDPTMQDCFMWIFPKDNPKNTRFAINFFTSIGLGGITESLREYLKNMPRLIMQQQKPVSESEDESGSSSSSGSDSSGSDSESESSSSEESDDKRRKRRRT